MGPFLSLSFSLFLSLSLSASLNSCVILLLVSIILLTASASVKLSLPSFPIVSPGMFAAFPVTNCNGENPALFTLVLCVNAAVFITTSVNLCLFSSNIFLIVMSQDAWFLSFIPLDQGLYAGPYLILIPNFDTNSSILTFLNYLPLSA